MGCNCGNKGGSSPTGYGHVSEAARQAEATAREQARAESMARAQAAGQAAQGVTQSFTLRSDAGQTQTFGSRLEALAAQARGEGRIVS